jgi:hypothetical protein
MDNWTCSRGRTQGQDTEADLNRLQWQVTETSSMGRSQAQFTVQGQDTEAGHRGSYRGGHRNMLQRQVTRTGYRGRSQVQATESGHRGSYIGGHRDRLQRQVTRTRYPYIGMSQGQLQRKSQGQDTEAGHRNRSEAGNNILGQVIHWQVTVAVTEVTETGYRGRSQGVRDRLQRQVTVRDKLQRQVRGEGRWQVTEIKNKKTKKKAGHEQVRGQGIRNIIRE